MSRDQPGERWASGSSLASHCQGIRPQFIRFRREDRHSRHHDIFSLHWHQIDYIKSQWKRSNHTYLFTEFLEYMEQCFAGAVASWQPTCLHIVWCGPEPGLPASTKHLTLLVLKSRKWKWKKYRGKLSNQELSPSCLDVDQLCLWHGSSPKRLGILRQKTTSFVMRQRH